MRTRRAKAAECPLDRRAGALSQLGIRVGRCSRSPDDAADGKAGRKKKLIIWCHIRNGICCFVALVLFCSRHLGTEVNEVNKDAPNCFSSVMNRSRAANSTLDGNALCQFVSIYAKSKL